ncbi:low-density lipoprotein receptor class A domain-containing protein 2 [Rhinophrynus dorsalis]
MVVNSHSDSRKYYFVTMGTDCRLTMQASAAKDKVQFQFRFFLVYSLLRMSNIQTDTLGLGTNGSAEGPSAPRTTKAPGLGTFHDPCNSGSYVQFYDGKDQNSVPLGTPLCGKTIPRPVLSTGNYLTLRLVTRGQQPRVDFVGDFTSFRLGFNASECSAEPYFHCHNGKCIPSSLVCDTNNIDNCGDGSDQSTKPPANCVSISPDRRGGSHKGTSGTGNPGDVPGATTVNPRELDETPPNLSIGTAGNYKPLSPDNHQHQGTTAGVGGQAKMQKVIHLSTLLVHYPWTCGRSRFAILVLLVTRMVHLENQRLSVYTLLQLLLCLLPPLHPQLCL